MQFPVGMKIAGRNCVEYIISEPPQRIDFLVLDLRGYVLGFFCGHRIADEGIFLARSLHVQILVQGASAPNLVDFSTTLFLNIAF